VDAPPRFARIEGKEEGTSVIGRGGGTMVSSSYAVQIADVCGVRSSAWTRRLASRESKVRKKELTT